MQENLNSDISIESSDTPEVKKPSLIRKIFFNILGFYAGYYAGILTIFLVEFILIDLIGSVGFIRSILSQPVDFETYALTGVIFADAAVSLKICAFISKFGKAKRNYSCFVLGAVRLIMYVTSAITTIVTDGFNLSFVWTLIVSLIGFFVFTIATANNEEL